MSNYQATRPISPRMGMPGAPLRRIGANHAMGHTAYHHTGAIELSTSGKIIGTVAVAAGAWHGYRRTGKARWAVVYALLAGLSPLITGAVMVAQGFGKRKAGG